MDEHVKSSDGLESRSNLQKLTSLLELILEWSETLIALPAVDAGLTQTILCQTLECHSKLVFTFDMVISVSKFFEIQGKDDQEARKP